MSSHRLRILRRGLSLTNPLDWSNPNDHTEHLETPKEKRAELVRIIDRHGFNWTVFNVAASGFFTESYNLFSLNVTFIMLAYVYEDIGRNENMEITLNTVTLAGSVVGQLFFGHLADRYGRRALYGVELIIVIFSTIGISQAATGFTYQNLTGPSNSMSILGWLAAWRFAMGVGIGAEYPLSACITAEWSATRSRARMMSAVFLMQPLGQLCAYLVGLCALVGLSRNHKDWGNSSDPLVLNESRIIIDRVWRTVSGVGAVPALVAILFRLSIPESGRFTYDVLGKQKAQQALDDTKKIYLRPSAQNSRSKDTESGDMMNGTISQTRRLEMQNARLSTTVTPTTKVNSSENITTVGRQEEPQGTSSTLSFQVPLQSPTNSGPGEDLRTEQRLEISEGPTEIIPSNRSISRFDESDFRRSVEDEDNDVSSTPGSDERKWTQFSFVELKSYFITQGRWKYLAGTSICWCLLDFAFYGLGFNKSGTLAKLWADGPIPSGPVWRMDSSLTDPNATIYDVIYNQAKQSLFTVSIGSFVGSIITVLAINRLDRRDFLVATFLVLAGLLCITGGTFLATFHTDSHAATIVLYALCQALFSFGPNTLLFIIPAEIFPTRYRCTCYGISAACGKLGSVLVQLVFLSWHDAGGLGDRNSPSLGRVFFIFGAFMACGAVFAWAWIPSIQEVRPVAATPAGANIKHRLESKTLEDLGGDHQNVENDNDVGFRNRCRNTKERFMRWRFRQQAP